MEPLAAVVLGLLQGVLEWLPVSSEAAVALVMTQLLGMEPVESVNTALYLHLGTMLAALVYFRRDFIEVLGNVPGCTREFVETGRIPDGYPLVNFLFFSTFFSGLLGGSIYVLGLERLPSDPRLFTGMVGVALLVTGAMKLVGKPSDRSYLAVNLLDSAEIGLLQGLAVIPGISRSGVTVFGLFALDFDSDDAFRLSFLMSVPAVAVAQVGVGLFSGFTVTAELALSSAVSALVGYLSIGALLEVAERVEVAYLCFLLAGLSFAALLI